MYWRDTFKLVSRNEIEIKFPGNYGAKGEKRAKPIKRSPEVIEKQNQRNRETYVRRLILLNFKAYDHWCTLKYPAGTRFNDLKTVNKDFGNFIKSLRGFYKRRGEELKYIYRFEIGEKGGVHIHILVNRIENGDSDKLIEKAWKPGSVFFENLKDKGDVDQLAVYIVKKKKESYKQLSLFEEDDRRKLSTYNCSRNLIKPKAERKFYRNRTVRKIINEGPKASKGFYIDKDSIKTGKNVYTGMSYIRYTELRLENSEEKIQSRGGGSS